LTARHVPTPLVVVVGGLIVLVFLLYFAAQLFVRA
jgi:hypothetical protein